VRNMSSESAAFLERPINDLDSTPSIPGRKCMWLLSWIFVFASVTLMTEFCLIHDMIVACDGPCGNGTGNHTGGTYPFKQPQIINFFGTVSCILWLQGFILLMYWNIYEVPPAFLSVLAVAFKIVASCFFNVQPASGLLMQVPLGVKWSNFVGICLFHTGNMINTYDMRSMFNPQRFLFSHGNLPVVGMWIYTLATTLLVTADGLEYFEVTSNFWIPFGQITGSALLGVGSLIYCYWSRPAWIIKPQSSDGVYDN